MPRPHMPHQSTVSMTYFLFACVLAACTVDAREKRQLFTACSGWGPSCSVYSSIGRDVVPAVSISRPSARRETPPVQEFYSRGRLGIPSLVTSGGWEPGTMGKRMQQEDSAIDLLWLLQQASRDNN